MNSESIASSANGTKRRGLVRSLLALGLAGVVIAVMSLRGLSAAPTAPVFYNDDGGASQIAFNSARINDTTPIFRLSATDSGNFNRFQVELNTASDFSGTSYTETFTGTYGSGVQYNLQTTATLNLPTTDAVTYYTRARASNDGGGSWGAWSTNTWTYTYKAAATAPEWYQTTDEQFATGTLSGTATSGSDSVQIAGAGTSVPTSAYGRWRASSIGLADGSAVTTWTDEGSGAHNLTQATVSDKPTYKTTSFNGHPAVEFDGVNDFLQTAAFGVPLVQPNTIVAMGEWITTPTGGSSAYLWDGQSAADRNTLLLDDSLGNHPWRIFAGTAVTGADGPTAGVDSVTLAIYDAANSDIFVNNVDSFSGGSPGNQSMGGFTLAGRFDGAATSPSGNLRIVEALVYNRALDSTERSNLQSYFQEKYAAASNAGTATSAPVTFDSFTAADSWGEFDWDETETNGSIAMQLYYTDSTTCDTLVPDGVLPGNATGFSTAGPVDISGLDPNVYSELCLRATFTNFGGTPFLENWGITALSANDVPDAPASLAQTKTDDSALAVGVYSNESTVKFTAQANDQDNPDTLQLCVEAQPLGMAFTNIETTCGSAVAHTNSSVAVTAQLSGLTEDGQYHWQARVKDAAFTYSPWVSFGSNAESERDFGIDAVPPPSGGGNGGGSSSGSSGSSSSGATAGTPGTAGSMAGGEVSPEPITEIPTPSNEEDTITLTQEPKESQGSKSFFATWGKSTLIGTGLILLAGGIGFVIYWFWGRRRPYGT